MAKESKKAADKKPAKDQKTEQQADAQPIFQLMGHYTKDVSFECPQPPIGTMPRMNFDLQVAVDVNNLQDSLREVVVKLTGTAKDENGKDLYVSEVSSAGIFRVENLKPDVFLQLLAVDGAAMVYPFSRQKLLSNVVDGGYPAPLLGPIDFRRLFEEGKKQAAGSA